jgi:hypothetical protein
VKIIFIFFILLNFSFAKAEVTGLWEFDGFLYQGHRYARPNPSLHVIFEFATPEILSLKWYRDDETAFCHRISLYGIEQNKIRQKIIWVDPDNSMSCSSDLDMQLGRESENRIEIVENQINLYLELNGEDFIYILKKMKKR